MKRLNLVILLFAPCIVAGMVGLLLFAFTRQHSIYTHDVYESHNAIMLIPFISIAAFFLGYVPAFCYLSKLLYTLPVECTELAEVREIAASSAPGLHIGQVITGTNCQLRVKALKNTIFAGLQDDQFTHCLQFSY